MVTHLLGLLMLVGVVTSSQGRSVEPGLVSKRRGPDVRAMRVEADVDDLGDVVRDRCQHRQVTRDRLSPHFELKVGYQSRQIGVSGPLSVSVDTSLDLSDPNLRRQNRRSNGGTHIVVVMNAEIVALEHLVHGGYRSGSLGWE